ncbi:diphthamide biosynthesis enzyme Dph2 [archaeon]|nr:MAG: diphthamide biosynthesis enzyme Dph2 [archaeon]RLG65696.1 MAG: diphthamide biosynthesis enzyme Dph2 [archaeon]HDM23559.1 diphthamide biosynthesis enzyme Dph2 [Candidatus Bathyarchaeota archaeon]
MTLKNRTFEIPRIELEKILEKTDFDAVLLEVPDGVKHLIPEILEIIRKKKHEAKVYISGEGCYGLCYIEDCEAKTIGVDLVINIGHVYKMNIKKHDDLTIIHVPLLVKKAKQIKGKIKEFIEKKLYHLIRKYRYIALSSTVEHYIFMQDFRRQLEKMHFKVFIGESGSLEKGLIIGCDYSNPMSLDDKCDVHVILASGRFHGLGLAMNTRKKVIVADILNWETLTFTEEEIGKIKKKRMAALGKMLNARRIGIIVGTTMGQRRMREAEKIAETLSKRGFQADIIVMKEVSGIKLLNLMHVYDAFVVCSCPRIAFDKEYEELKIPIILPDELYEVLEG